MNAGEVRLALPEDVDAVYGLVETQHEETGVFDFDRPLVRSIVEQLVSDRAAGVVGVIDGPKGDIVATSGLSLMPGAWYTREPILYELWAYVRPEHRRTTYAKNLIAFSKRFVQTLDQAGVPTAYFSLVKMLDTTERKQALYARQADELGSFALYLYRPRELAHV